MNRVFFIFILLLSVSTVSFAQERNIYFYDISPKFGKVIPSPRSDGNISNAALAGGVIGFGVQTTGRNYWEEFFNYPKYGLRLGYTDYADKIFGKGISLHLFMQGAFFRANKFSLDYSLGLGFGWHSKHYHLKKNPNNDYMSTSLSACIDLAIVAEYMITPQIGTFLGGNFSHFSNGATHMPNLGINGLSAFGGIRYYDRKNDHREFRNEIEKPRFLKNEIYTFIAPSFMSYRKWGNKSFFGSTFEVGYRRQFHPCMKWGAGVDIFYAGYEKYEIDESVRSNWDNVSQAVFGSFELLFGDMSFHVALGVCTYYSAKPKGIIYERAGIYYNFGKNFKQFAGASIKAYGGVADYIEWTYGFKIKSF